MGKMKAGILGFRVLECHDLLGIGGIGKNSIHGRVASTIPTRRVCAFAVRVSMQRHHMLCQLVSIVAKELLNGQRVVVVQRWRFPACCERRIIFPAVPVANRSQVLSAFFGFQVLSNYNTDFLPFHTYPAVSTRGTRRSFLSFEFHALGRSRTPSPFTSPGQPLPPSGEQRW